MKMIGHGPYILELGIFSEQNTNHVLEKHMNIGLKLRGRTGTKFDLVVRVCGPQGPQQFTP